MHTVFGALFGTIFIAGIVLVNIPQLEYAGEQCLTIAVLTGLAWVVTSIIAGIKHWAENNFGRN